MNSKNIKIDNDAIVAKLIQESLQFAKKDNQQQIKQLELQK